MQYILFLASRFQCFFFSFVQVLFHLPLFLVQERERERENLHSFTGVIRNPGLICNFRSLQALRGHPDHHHHHVDPDRLSILPPAE